MRVGATPTANPPDTAVGVRACGVIEVEVGFSLSLSAAAVSVLVFEWRGEADYSKVTAAGGLDSAGETRRRPIDDAEDAEDLEVYYWR